ncbi:MAG: hypothetical protein V4580_06635 [Bacteroidota bacterium]
MKSVLKYLFFLIGLFFVPNTSAQNLSTTETVSYNSKTNTTQYIVFPIGSVSIPGLWTKERYNSVSGQQWFLNQDSIKLAVAFTTCNNYEFSKKNLKNLAFTKAYYEWDSNYLSERHQAKREIIVSDSIHEYIIWRLHNEHYDSYFLVGTQKCNVHVYEVVSSLWKEDQKIKFLQDLYVTKK